MSDELLGVALGGRYHVEQKIADAMLGRVYSARNLEDGRLYHVKVPYANVAGNPEKSERFRRELEAMERIENPHTVRVIDTGIHESIAFLVLEFLAATPLTTLLDRGRLPPSRVAGIVAQIAWACEAAHAGGVVHRNLSPQTVLLLDNAQDRDFVKVTDFGLSRMVDADAEEAGGVLTQVGTRIGNVLYMAPEYIESDEVLPAGDMYGLGALTYHLLTGAPPFAGRAADVLTRHVTDEAPRPSAAVPGLPAWCDTLVARLMAKEPHRRPDAKQVVAALEQEFGPLRAPKLLAIDPEGKVVRKSRAPVYFAIAGTLLLAVGVATFMVVMGTIVAGVVVSQVLAMAPESHDLLPAPDAVLPPPAAAAPGSSPQPAPGPRPRSEPGLPVGTSPLPADPRAPTAEDAPAAPHPVTSTLRVGANQRALVHLDEVPIGYTPLELTTGPGLHTVSATLPGKPASRQSRTIQVEPSTNPVPIDFRF